MNYDLDLEEIILYLNANEPTGKYCKNIENLKNKLQRLESIDNQIETGELSDGYHTFNQLYYQRCILFAALVRLNKDKSWKSFKHSDNKYCFDSNGEWFIVGIDTPIGSYTYHYEKKYWELFECQELECGKEWDGHTEGDVTRLLSLATESKKELAFEYLTKYFNIECEIDSMANGEVWGRLVHIQAKEDEGTCDTTATANLVDYEDEFNLLKELV